MPSRDEIRCFCRRQPLLAIEGRALDGRCYVHVKSWKNKRLYTEVVITQGTVRVRCRECLRWHRISVSEQKVSSTSQSLPQSLSKIEGADSV